jgi:transcription-repair coupling factor (superfamily II helicase)
VTNLQTILSATRPITLAGAPSVSCPGWQRTWRGRRRGAPSISRPTRQRCGTWPIRRAISRRSWRSSPSRPGICLPYDRSSPSLRSSSERLAALHALQRKPEGPQLVVTTINAVTQRTLTPFRIRQLVARLVPGERIDRDRLALLLGANGYVRTDTVADAGEICGAR